MASRKSTKRSALQPPNPAAAADKLAEFAGNVLAQPESRSRSIILDLSPSERAVVAGWPGLPAAVTEQLATRSLDATSIDLTLADLALVCLGLSSALRTAEVTDLFQLLLLVGKIFIQLDSGIKGLATPSGNRGPAHVPPGSQATGYAYQLKITLRHISPPIWRRVQIRDCSLADLHNAIQAAMGWANCHLYAFKIGGRSYAGPGRASEMGMADASLAKLSGLVSRAKAKFRYTYDFGDNWEHDILVEKILALEEGTPPTLFLGGKRACPPEDVGGPWGYREYLEAIRDPNHERHEEMLEWGGEFDPDAVDS